MEDMVWLPKAEPSDDRRKGSSRSSNVDVCSRSERSLTRMIAMVVLGAVLLGSLGWLGWVYLGAHRGNTLYTATVEEYFDPQESSKTGPIVNFEKLKSQNADIKGWIYIKESHINYPILHAPKEEGGDNKYLRRTYDGKRDILGSIILSEYNSPAFTDQNTLIFGHNSHGTSMFGSLKDYARPSYFESHPTISILLEGKTLEYQVFSCFETDSNSEVYTTSFKNDDAFVGWKERMLSNSVITIQDGAVHGTASTLVLSTCSNSSASSRRFVVVAELSDVITRFD